MQLLQGATLIRALFNESMRDYRISGEILDLGSKTSSSKYYDYLIVDDESRITFTDLYESEGVIKVNIEEKMPFADNSFDYVLAFHLFEHVYHFDFAIMEIFRILKPEGKLIVSVPFMHKYHADPDDYYRFTDTALMRICEEKGFQCESMEYVGEGIYTFCLTTMMRFGRPKFLSNMLQCFFYSIATIIDRMVNVRQKRKKKYKEKTMAQLYALEHIAIFKK